MSEYREAACSRMRAARKYSRKPAEQFAGELSEMLGWDIYPGVIERWETRNAPPADALLAAEELAASRPRRLEVVR